MEIPYGSCAHEGEGVGARRARPPAAGPAGLRRPAQPALREPDRDPADGERLRRLRLRGGRGVRGGIRPAPLRTVGWDRSQLRPAARRRRPVPANRPRRPRAGRAGDRRRHPLRGAALPALRPRPARLRRVGRGRSRGGGADGEDRSGEGPAGPDGPRIRLPDRRLLHPRRPPLPGSIRLRRNAERPARSHRRAVLPGRSQPLRRARTAPRRPAGRRARPADGVARPHTAPTEARAVGRARPLLVQRRIDHPS